VKISKLEAKFDRKANVVSSQSDRAKPPDFDRPGGYSISIYDFISVIS
jgi:hypothetical protein